MFTIIVRRGFTRAHPTHWHPEPGECPRPLYKDTNYRRSICPCIKQAPSLIRRWIWRNPIFKIYLKEFKISIPESASFSLAGVPGEPLVLHHTRYVHCTSRLAGYIAFCTHIFLVPLLRTKGPARWRGPPCYIFVLLIHSECKRHWKEDP